MSLNPKRLPPLAALRAFDAVARHRSIQKAATELGVTASAVSQQVKALEADLGMTLLHRLHRAVELTEAGKLLAPDLQAGFERLSFGVALLRADAQSTSLTVSAAPSLAAKWLVPRLADFHAAHPSVELRLLADNAMCDFTRDGVDVALRHGNGRYDGCVSHHILSPTVIPVCSPRLLGRSLAPLKPEEVLKYTLLHNTASESGRGLPCWAEWFAAAGIKSADTEKGPRFSNAHLVIEASIAGRGVALGVEAFSSIDIEAGRLVRPCALSVKRPGAYWCVSPEATVSQPKVRQFRGWILRQTQVYLPIDKDCGRRIRSPDGISSSAIQQGMSPCPDLSCPYQSFSAAASRPNSSNSFISQNGTEKRKRMKSSRSRSAARRYPRHANSLGTRKG